MNSHYRMFKPQVDIDACIKNVRHVLESGYLNEGMEVSQLQSKFSSIFDHANVVMTNSCTSALLMALKLAGVGRGDEVITTSMTCIATNMPIAFLDAKIVWADIDLMTGNIDPTCVERLINERTKAVVCVHWAGNPCQLDVLQEICRRRGIKLIQDAAHALDARFNGQHVCHYGDITCYSLQAIKHVTAGDGGIIVCNDDNDHRHAERMKWFGIDRNSTKDINGEWKGQRWDVDVSDVGLKFHMNNIAAAVCLANLESYEHVMNAHRRNASIYDDKFATNSLIHPLSVDLKATSSYWVYTTLLDNAVCRDSVLLELNKKNIDAGLVHVPNHAYTCFCDSYVVLDETEKFNNMQISLPCGSWLNGDDIRHIADCLIETVEAHR